MKMLLNGYGWIICQAKDIYRSRRKDVTVKGSTFSSRLPCSHTLFMLLQCTVSFIADVGDRVYWLLFLADDGKNKKRMIWHRVGGTLYTQLNKRKRRTTTTFLAFCFVTTCLFLLRITSALLRFFFGGGTLIAQLLASSVTVLTRWW